MAVVETAEREHVHPLSATDADLAVEPHQGVDARAAVAGAGADPVCPPRVGDGVAEGERLPVLVRLNPSAMPVD